FYSSRRRHTRSKRDWSSDVCSSDLQSLIAMEMQVDVLRRTSDKSVSITDELGRIQGLLREEVLKLRELMQQMKSLDVDSRRLLRSEERRVGKEGGFWWALYDYQISV